MLLSQLQFNTRPSPPVPVVVWMKIYLQKSSIKYESQKWPPEAVLRRGSGSVNTALSKTLTRGRTVKSVVFHCNDFGSPNGSL